MLKVVLCLFVCSILGAPAAAFGQTQAVAAATPTAESVSVPANGAEAGGPSSPSPNNPAVVAPAPATGTAPESAGAASLSPEKSRPVGVPRFDKPVAIDGRLDDEIWKQAIVLKNFLQTQPGDNIAPSRQTEVMLGYDANYLYVAFRAYDDAEHVRATVAKRDDIFDDDYVGLYLDTFNDQRRAYAFFFNPLGVQADGVLTEGRGEDYSVDVLMQSKGALDAGGYTVEVAIPFKSLRYSDGKAWGVHFVRSIKHFNNEQNSWMPLSRDRSGLLNQAGQLTGFKDIGHGRVIEIIPSLTISETGRRVRSLPRGFGEDPGRLLNEPIKIDPGLTAKIGITPDVTLDLAVNPDFAQVEADQPVVTANQRFPIFFEEKRPFFLEGKEIFDSRLNVVHTRAIVDPDLAVKLTGKQGRNTFGVLLASDNAPGNFNEEERLDPQNFPFVDKNAYIGVFRLKRDIGRESSIGFLGTTYNFPEAHNHVGGIDGRFRIDPTTVFDFQVVGTTTRSWFFDPDRGEYVYRTGNALGYAFQLDRTSRNFNFNVRGDGRSNFYRADVGFTQRTNTNTQRYFARYASEPDPKGRIVSWFVSNATPVSFDWQARMQSWNNESRIGVNLQRQTSVSIGFNGGYERLFESEFGPNRNLTRAGTFAGDDSERSTYKKTIFFNAASKPSKKFLASIFVAKTAGAFDFDFGAGHRFPRVSPGALVNPDASLDPGPGDMLQVQAFAAYQPTDTLRTTFDYTRLRLNRYDTDRTAFDVSIYSLRTTYQFSRDTFVRGRLDYSTLPNNLFAQLLLGWTPNPGTSFYVGYNDDLNRGEQSPFTGQLEPGFRRNGRTFFIKMSYLFRRTF
jgi:hypothetical protein